MTVFTKEYHNGFKIIYEKSSIELPLTTIFIFCNIGSVHETENLKGAAHFIEHMCFKGTKKILHSKDIFFEYSKNGSYLNAYTNKRYTCYTIKCQDKYVKHSLEILSDMLINSTFNEKEFEKEEKVIVEENNNDNNDPESIIEDVIEQQLYKNTSYEYPIDCLEYHSKQKFKYKEIIDFYHKYYIPYNMSLSIVTNHSFKNIENFIKKTFFFEKSKEIIKPTVPIIYNDLILNNETQYKIIEKKGITNVLISIGFRTCGKNSKDKFSLNVLSEILGNSLNGRLMMILREKYNLVYNASVSTNYYEEMGDFTFKTKTSISNLFKKKNKHGVLELLFKIIRDVIKNGITEKELHYIKGYIEGNFLILLQDIVNQTVYNGEETIYESLGNEKIVPFSKIYETYIKNITLKEINEVIQKYFILNKMYFCILSEKLPSLKTILKEIKI
jgi:predicted Zn-dependent peptidase